MKRSTYWKFNIFDIIRFNRGPQDLPTNIRLLNITILANILIGQIPSDAQYNFIASLLTTTIFIGITLIFIQVCLYVKEANTGMSNIYKARYLQTASAVLGIHALIGLFASLLFLMTKNDPNTVMIIVLLTSLYSWIVYGHIFKYTFDTSMIFGLAISFLYSMVAGFIMLLFLQAFFL